MSGKISTRYKSKQILKIKRKLTRGIKGSVLLDLQIALQNLWRVREEARFILAHKSKRSVFMITLYKGVDVLFLKCDPWQNIIEF